MSKTVQHLQVKDMSYLRFNNPSGFNPRNIVRVINDPPIHIRALRITLNKRFHVAVTNVNPVFHDRNILRHHKDTVTLVIHQHIVPWNNIRIVLIRSKIVVIHRLHVSDSPMTSFEDNIKILRDFKIANLLSMNMDRLITVLRHLQGTMCDSKINTRNSVPSHLRGTPLTVVLVLNNLVLILPTNSNVCLFDRKRQPATHHQATLQMLALHMKKLDRGKRRTLDLLLRT